MLAIAANIKTIKMGEVMLFASLNDLANIQMQRLTADANMEKIGRQRSKDINAGTKRLKSKFANPSPCKSTICIMIKTMPNMERRFKIAENTAIVDTERNLEIIIWLFFTGRVMMVSSVPLSLSPAVASIAG